MSPLASSTEKHPHHDVTVNMDDNKPDKDKNMVIKDTDGTSIGLGQSDEDDLYQPLSGIQPYDGRTLCTARAILTGSVLGSLIACSNIYLGFGADATLFSVIFGYSICKALEKSKIPFVSGHFGPHENNTIQATALGTVGIGSMFISGVPAMYQLGLLSSSPQSDFGKLFCLTLASGLLGLGFVVPFRRLFILKLARQLSLSFPLGTAAAITIRALHTSNEEVSTAKEKLTTILWTFGGTLVWSVVTSYAPGILYSWNPFFWIYKWGGHSIIGAVNWGWLSWQWSPSIIGMGMLIDLNASFSLLLGSVLAWGVIGPSLVVSGQAIGIPFDPNNPDLITYNAFIPTQFITSPSPRYWILWPAVFMMLAASLTTLFMESKSFGKLAIYSYRQACAKLKDLTGRNPQSCNEALSRGQDADAVQGEITDPVAKEHQVRWWEWSTISLLPCVIAMVTFKYLYGISPAIILLNILLGLIWSLVVIQVFGASGINPAGTVAKGSQFITGGIVRNPADTVMSATAAKSVLVGPTLGSYATMQAGELCQDFRTGFLLGTPARAQWHAQILGTLVAATLTPGIFILFTKAFPCIIDATTTQCQFAMPSITTWRVVTEAILAPQFPISQSSWIFSIVSSVLAVVAVLLKRHMMQKPSLKRYHVWVPNMALVGLSMTIGSSQPTLTLAIGAVAANIWEKFWPKSHERFMYSIASGGVAGEGVAYVILSILQIAGVGGDKYGTMIGCYGGAC
ncbi:hypothetical protein NW766_006421 [Fusarium irregulare]|uniref:Oligopeptide transporter n=1 Tax=Fusarium irregulare TaxID=2494466 RepID=A0A9W8PQH9_9HYPO|nr:hypothetical protein NW766_006421 [Fusarium irregulare]